MAENCDFTAEEHLINQKRYDEGYDFQDNHRYNLWVETYTPVLEKQSHQTSSDDVEPSGVHVK